MPPKAANVVVNRVFPLSSVPTKLEAWYPQNGMKCEKCEMLLFVDEVFRTEYSSSTYQCCVLMTSHDGGAGVIVLHSLRGCQSPELAVECCLFTTAFD